MRMRDLGRANAECVEDKNRIENRLKFEGGLGTHTAREGPRVNAQAELAR